MMQFIVIAARNLLKSRTRTLILGGAITSVTAFLVVLMAITAGVETTLLESGTSLGSGHVNIAGFYKINQNSAAPLVTGYKPLEDLARSQFPEAKLIIDRIKSYGKVISDTNSVTIPMWGVDMKKERPIIGDLPLARKRDYIENFAAKPGEPEVEGNLMDLERPGSMAIFANHAKKLKVKVGDTVTISMPTNRNVNNTKDVRIAAVLQDLGLLSSFTAFMHHEDVRNLYQMGPDSTGQLMIYLNSVDQVPAVEARLRKVIADKGYRVMDKDPQAYFMKFDRISGESWTGQKIDVTTWQDETSYAKWVLDLLHSLTFIFTLILMVIVVMGLVNALWMAIRERTAEIGTLRAIGLQRRQVMLMILLESVILSVCGALTGITLGVAFSLFLNALHIPVTSDAARMFLMASEFTLSIRGSDLLKAFLLITVFLVLGSLLPAYRAGKLKPITAMNHVD